jgi:pyridoxamine 5'-phosphate oxidase
MNLTELRMQYAQGELHEHQVDTDPIGQFEAWLNEALKAELHEPYAMTLATATPEGMPSARIVLLRQVDERGLTFFTNYDSRKGQELAGNPNAALLFYWGELQRQVRIEGVVSKVTPAESDSYFHSRPLGSQMAAAVSAQSAVIPDRAGLEMAYAALEAKYRGQTVPCPPHWGGYRLQPRMFEFWQGRLHRLHDRLRYRRRDKDGWVIERLAP